MIFNATVTSPVSLKITTPSSFEVVTVFKNN
jgi:hypothetical protein